MLETRHYGPSSDGGGENWAALATLIETCKLSRVDPRAYLADAFISTAKSTTCHGLIPPSTNPSGTWPANIAYARLVSARGSQSRGADATVPLAFVSPPAEINADENTQREKCELALFIDQTVVLFE